MVYLTYKIKGDVMQFVNLHYIVGNALVELKENANIDRVTFKQIRDYGEAVVQKLNNRSIFLFSNVYFKELFQDYGKYFSRSQDGVSINENASTDDIRKHILAYASVDILEAMLSQDCIEKLGLENQEEKETSL